MNILFLTISNLESLEEHGIYADLLRCFRDHGHEVYTVSSREKRSSEPTEYSEKNKIHSLRVRVGNITKCDLLEKGLSTICIEQQYKKAVCKYLGNVIFDLILYSTPPITLAGVVEYVKHRDNAKTYLLLKDIFPQNAVDLGMMSSHGIKAPLYWYFRRKEKKLYEISDRIGCMSQANVDYVLKHNPEISADKVEVCPNSIEIMDFSLNNEEKPAIRNKYGIPIDKKVFVYGGNLGKPQGIPFIIDCLRAEKDNEDAFFLIAGDGTEYGKLEAFVDKEKPANIKLLKRLPKEDYDRMIAACDVGMIFLDHRFTIPNYPSRLLSYMQAGLPVLACTDPNTDIGKTITEGGFGWWCESNDINGFKKIVIRACRADTSGMKNNSTAYLHEHFSVEQSYRIIMNSLGRLHESITD